ncbi:MAG TPA: biopolymer transporter ExbD [Opitutaceae bacterium]|jgi:biopolymer transport protein ExbD|nr:biopolymer transporter ExbD [Opitutaceae bacterium]
MHAGHHAGRKRARIEIIPLIDIMFFLLASFMLVSLNLINAKSVKVSLPIAQTGDPENRPSTLSISVDATGGIYLDKTPIGRNELQAELARQRAQNPEVRVVISGDENTRHGAMIGVLDRVRAAGIQNVAFQTREPEAPATP